MAQISVTDWVRRSYRQQGPLVFAVWFTLIVAALVALATARWSMAFVAVTTLFVSMLPAVFIHRFNLKLPVHFFAAIVVFIFATIFLGEALDFYERVWWWDIALHGASAIGFGLVGFLFMLMLFQGDRYAAPPIAVSFFAFCFAVSIGTMWEIFEFGMDQIFGLNMQKSGLVDTMSDLMVDMLGASLGAAAGFFYLKKRELGGVSGVIREFVRMNHRLFSKNDDSDEA